MGPLEQCEARGSPNAILIVVSNTWIILGGWGMGGGQQANNPNVINQHIYFSLESLFCIFCVIVSHCNIETGRETLTQLGILK